MKVGVDTGADVLVPSHEQTGARTIPTATMVNRKCQTDETLAYPVASVSDTVSTV